MTTKTNRNYIEPVLGRIAFVVMVMFSSFTARTLQSIKSRQLTNTNSIINNFTGFNSVRMTNALLFRRSKEFCFTFLTFVITFSCQFTFLALFIVLVDSFASFALSIMFSLFFTFFALTIFPLCSFEIFSLLVPLSILCLLLTLTYFADIHMSTAHFGVFIKFRDIFGLLADAASFRYDLLRHGRFSLNVKRLCLEPNSPPVGLSGSLYSTAYPKQMSNPFLIPGD